uniref:BACK domain-containing protein n=1 Tax=Tetradesmus obliquus TaxID=3088 RepID=A0A383VPT2_TETOB|eukprot:jgi/Sobl393_1/15239/SZX75107.1
MGAAQWVTLQADSYEAKVSVATLCAYPDSCLANMVEMELASCAADSAATHPCIRLDCCESVAREVVALLRQRDSYSPPTDARLLRALQQQLDFLGLPGPQVVSGQEVVLVPSYRLESMLDGASWGRHGMYIYSSSTRGWANIAGDQDCRPAKMQANGKAGSGLVCCASTLRAERTGAGQDLAVVVTNSWQDNATALMIDSTLGCKQIRSPLQHTLVVNSAMAAAGGKLYLLGGERHPHALLDAGTPFEVYDPHVNAWHQAQAPQLPGGCISSHALVSNRSEGLLLAIGGYNSDERTALASASSHVLLYDVAGGSWRVDPSGCMYPGAGSETWAAAAVDDHAIMVLGSSSDGTSARNDLLDLRMWRWRDGCGLLNDMTHNIGLVMYEGRALAVGGRQAYADFDSEGVAMPSATRKVRAYDVANDAWSELPPLPYTGPKAVGVIDACPVAMRLRNALNWLA